MQEQELKTFIDVVVGYFRDVTDEEAHMGVPFIKAEESMVLDYTALIGISGPKKGGIYLTAEKELLSELCKSLLEMDDAPEDMLTDMAGELANTIAGNVRMTFGSSFMISVPMILSGTPNDIIIKLAPPVFIIPIEWKGTKAYLAVGLE
jgi:chemotaxis protein CheX